MEAEQVRDLVAGADRTRTYQDRDRMVVVGGGGAVDDVGARWTARGRTSGNDRLGWRSAKARLWMCPR
jgi:hypothetical protein